MRKNKRNLRDVIRERRRVILKKSLTPKRIISPQEFVKPEYLKAYLDYAEQHRIEARLDELNLILMDPRFEDL